MKIEDQIVRSLIWHISRHATRGMTPVFAIILLFLFLAFGMMK